MPWQMKFERWHERIAFPVDRGHVRELKGKSNERDNAD